MGSKRRKIVDHYKNRRRIEQASDKFLHSGIAIFMLSFSALTLEIALARIFSVLFSYHYVFTIVSLSLFGIGLGGMSLNRWKIWFPRAGISTYSRTVGWDILSSGRSPT